MCYTIADAKMQGDDIHWFAVKVRQEVRAEKFFNTHCREVFFPREEIRTPGGLVRTLAVIPHVMFIRTSADNALALEQEGRQQAGQTVPFWIYRYSKGEAIQPIGDEQIHLLRLLTSSDSSKCEIFRKSDFKRGELVRVTGGIYQGYVGTVQRVRKNKHVVVEIEGICMVMLPFIHPDLLEPIS
ncbi:MAG: hypothetical protein K2J07_05855 [Muribaculaceae bacterium]|nr:hypothetical protein [Muribaculaceae bacterium]